MRKTPLVLVLLAACAGPADSYVEGDEATYNAIAPEFAVYVTKDPSLDSTQKEDRYRTLRTWLSRIQKAKAGGRQ